MNFGTAQPHQLGQYAVAALVALLVIGFRMRRLSRLRPLKLEQLWIIPALYALLVVSLFLRALPVTAAGWAICALALAAGAALGWQRGRLMHISVDPATHALNQKASMAGLVFIVLLIGIKVVAQTEGEMFHFNVMLLAQAFGMLALGMFTVMRIEMYLRAKRLLAEARAARA